MRRVGLDALDMPTALVILSGAMSCYAAWLTSIVFCATHGAQSLLIAAATFFPIGVVHGVGLWFGGW
jgi:hypothetical protein